MPPSDSYFWDGVAAVVVILVLLVVIVAMLTWGE
jgi:hypothetical protein